MKIPVLNPKQRVLSSFLLLAMAAFALYAANRKPGGWWKGGDYNLFIVEVSGGYHPQQERILISNSSISTNHKYFHETELAVQGQAAEEIVKLLNKHDVWSWTPEIKPSSSIGDSCLVILEYHGKTNAWAWHPNIQPAPKTLTRTIENIVRDLFRLNKHRIRHTSEMNQQYKDIQRIMLAHTNDVTIVR